MVSKESIYYLLKDLCSCLLKNHFYLKRNIMLQHYLSRAYEIILGHEIREHKFNSQEDVYCYIYCLKRKNCFNAASKLESLMEHLINIELNGESIGTILRLLMTLADSHKEHTTKDPLFCFFPLLDLNNNDHELGVDEGFNEGSQQGTYDEEDVKVEDDVWGKLLNHQGEMITFMSWDTAQRFQKPSELPYITELASSTSFDIPLDLNPMFVHQNILLKSLCHGDLTSKSFFIQDVAKLIIGLPSGSFHIENNKLRMANGGKYLCNCKLIEEFVHVGNSMRNIMQFVHQYLSLPGSFMHPLAQSISSYLNVLRCMVFSVVWQNQLSVLQVAIKFKKIFKQLRFLLRLCSDVEDALDDSHLLSCLYEHWTEAEDDMKGFIFYLFKSSSIGYFRCMEMWVYNGELDIHSGHFMISHNPLFINKRDETFWKFGFKLLPMDNIPVFLHEHSSTIMTCGKSIQLLKLCSNKYVEYFIGCSKPGLNIASSKRATMHHRLKCENYLRSTMQFFSTPNVLEGVNENDVQHKTLTSTDGLSFECGQSNQNSDLLSNIEAKVFSMVQINRLVYNGNNVNQMMLTSNSEESDEDVGNDLDQFIEDGIINSIRIQYHLLNYTILNYYINDVRIKEYYEILRRFVLLQDDYFSIVLVNSLSEHLDSFYDCKHHNTFTVFSPTFLNNMLQHSLSSVEQQNISGLTDLLSFTFDHKSDCLISKNEVFDLLGMTMRIGWPVNIVLQQKHLDSYNILFKFFFKLRHIIWSLNDIHSILRKNFKAAKSYEVQSLRKLLFYWQNMQHFVKALQEYVTNQVMQVSWHEFEQKLNLPSNEKCNYSKIENLDQLIDENTKFLNKCLSQCLLNKPSFSVLSIINNLFNLILNFRSQLKFQYWNDTAWQQVFKENFQKFHDGCVFLYKVLVKLEQKSHQTYLQELLLRINFNEFY